MAAPGVTGSLYAWHANCLAPHGPVGAGLLAIAVTNATPSSLACRIAASQRLQAVVGLALAYVLLQRRLSLAQFDFQ